MESLKMTWAEAVKECDKERMCLAKPETKRERVSQWRWKEVILYAIVMAEIEKETIYENQI